jgi:glucose uptake protein GlcU
MKVGFPLTQTCVVFNALWGIFYFKEIDLFDGKSKNFIRFTCGLAAIILGSFFLADSAA